MSGTAVNRALQERFEAIHRAEFDRLRKKLGGLNDDERATVEAITADIIQAIARVPERALTSGTQPPSLEAVVRLFGLDGESARLPC